MHGMKMWGLYKRNGNRVILNGQGDLVVQPTHLQLSLLQVRLALHDGVPGTRLQGCLEAVLAGLDTPARFLSVTAASVCRRQSSLVLHALQDAATSAEVMCRIPSANP